MKKTWTAIDLFCGAGGLSEGFRQAGFCVLAGNDFNEQSGTTFSQTHKDAVFLPGKIQKYTAENFLRASGIEEGTLDCLIGGPPCQSYSVYNHQRGLHDHRSELFREYLRLVKGIRPKWVVMENVTGILSVGCGMAVQSIVSGLEELGYRVEYKTLKAEEYGVPQERRRVLFVGNRLDQEIKFPERTHGPDALPYVTVKQAIGDLPLLTNGRTFHPAPYTRKATSDFQKTARKNSKMVLNHSAPKLGQVNLDRMHFIPQGGSWRDIPFDLLPKGMKAARRCDHTKRYGRLSWNGLASTILTKCDLHWGAFIHPAQNRSLTVREAARLQSFPDWFSFSGSKTEQYVQVGNAVPPLLALAVAESILQSARPEVKISYAA